MSEYIDYGTGESNVNESYVGGSDESNWLADEAIKLAVPHLAEYRSDRDVILESVKNYLKNNREVLISSKVKLIDGLDIEYTTVLCCNNAFKHANNLTNWIYEKNKDLPYINTVQMRTIVEKEEFKIDYNTKTIFHLMPLAPYDPDKSHWNYTRAITPLEIDQQRYLPPEIELIDLYNQLSINGESKQLINTEGILYNMTLTRYKIDNKSDSSPAVSGGKSCQERKRELLDICKIAIIQDWLPKQQNTVVLGSWGYNLWKLSKKNICINQDRVQICTMVPHKQLTSTIQKFINSTINPNLQIVHSETRGLNLPGEFRTERHVYSIVMPDSTGMKEKPFLEIYDILDYIPIPVIKTDGCLIASKYVMIRFLLIDLWSFTILKTFDKIPVLMYNEKLTRIFKCIADIKDNFPIPVCIIGKFVDYAIFKSNRSKRLSKQSGRFMPYIPWLEQKRTGKLRVI